MRTDKETDGKHYEAKSRFFRNFSKAPKNVQHPRIVIYYVVQQDTQCCLNE